MAAPLRHLEIFTQISATLRFAATDDPEPPVFFSAVGWQRLEIDMGGDADDLIHQVRCDANRRLSAGPFGDGPQVYLGRMTGICWASDIGVVGHSVDKSSVSRQGCQM